MPRHYRTPTGSTPRAGTQGKIDLEAAIRALLSRQRTGQPRLPIDPRARRGQRVGRERRSQDSLRQFMEFERGQTQPPIEVMGRDSGPDRRPVYGPPAPQPSLEDQLGFDPSQPFTNPFRRAESTPEEQAQLLDMDALLAQHLGPIEESYDQMIAALAGQGDVMRQQAGTAQENIGSFFDYAGDVALRGQEPMRETHEGAQANVGTIYDELGQALGGLPQQQVDIAQAAGGLRDPSGVSERVAAATAPFAAAAETARANATANLEQHGAAGQQYLESLASATGAESAMAQTSVEQALQQNLNQVAFRTAEIEAQKQEALARATADISGSIAQQASQEALMASLGLEGMPAGMDLDTLNKYLLSQSRMANIEGTNLLNIGREMDLGERMDPEHDTGIGRVRDFIRTRVDDEGMASTLEQSVRGVLNATNQTVLELTQMGQSASQQQQYNIALGELQRFLPEVSRRQNPRARQAYDVLSDALRQYYGQ